MSPPVPLLRHQRGRSTASGGASSTREESRACSRPGHTRKCDDSASAGAALRAQRLSTARMDSTGTAPRAIVRALRRPGQHRHPCGQPPPYRAHPCNLCGTPQRVCAGRAAVILAPGPPPRSCRPDYAHPRSRSGRRSPTTGSADADTAGGIEAAARQSCSSLTSTVRDRSPQHEQDLLPDRLASSVPLGGPHSQATPVPPIDVFSPVSLSANDSHRTETGNRTMFCTPGLPPGSVEKQRAARTVSGSELAGKSY